MSDDMTFAAFAGARTLVTGGMGFIGSALATRLVGLGAEVTIVDDMDEEGGANPANVAAIAGRFALVRADIRDTDALAPLLDGRAYLFNLAARTSHMGSLAAPLADLDVNGRAPLALLRDGRGRSGAKLLRDTAGLRVAVSSDFEGTTRPTPLRAGEGMLFERLGIALLHADPDLARALHESGADRVWFKLAPLAELFVVPPSGGPGGSPPSTCQK